MAEVTKLKDVTSLVFDRLATHDHPWSRAMSSLEMDDDIGKMALCRNLRMDHRVSESREQNMLDAPQFSVKPDGEYLLKQWREYFQSDICLPSETTTGGRRSAYLELHNDINRITNRSISFDLLIHVGSLNRILWWLTSSKYANSNVFNMDFQDVTNCTMPRRKPNDTEFYLTSFNASIDTLAGDLIEQGEDIVKRMAGLLCDTLGNTQPPWWACFAEEVAPYIQSGNWAALCKSLGLGHFKENEWILIWQYEVGSVGDVFRPTMVEAEDSPYHYPSPPSSQYGVTMPLGPDLPLCREIIHPPLSGILAEEACTGQLYQIKGFHLEEHGLYNDIPKLRLNHRDCLEDEFTTAKDHDWLERHKDTKRLTKG